MSSSLAATLTRRGYVAVSPKPTTLSETSAILKALQYFGSVETFLNPRYVRALEKYSKLFVVYKDSGSLQKARDASPLTVDVGYDAIDPEEADPFNVRGFWDRKKVERKTVQCFVYMQKGRQHNENWNQRVVEANPYHGPFRVNRLAISFQDLMRQGAPSPEFADCIPQPLLNEFQKTRMEDKAKWRSFYKTDENGEITGGLMDTWREKLEPKAASGPKETPQRFVDT